jgi:Flp pilus assembly protein TadG
VSKAIVMHKSNRTPLIRRLLALLPARFARRFTRAQEGAAAVEFALVAVPFLALTFAIMETALVFFSGQTLEAAAAASARLIMTGQAQTAGFSATAFKQAVCNQIFGLFDCANGITVDVKSYANFAAVNTTPPVTNGQLDTSNVAYSPGGPGSIVVVTLYYKWPIYVTLLGDKLDNLNGGNRLLVATNIFRNEPYQ